MFKATDTLDPLFIARPLHELWSLISPLYMADESSWLKELLPMATPSEQESPLIIKNATELINRVRADKQAIQMIDALLQEYSLDTKEGILLMCLAEALMRIPDAATADALILDKLSVADWKSHLKGSDSTFVNASTWGLLLTGKVISMQSHESGTPASVINRLVNKLSEPVIRQVMNRAMTIMGHQFVLGRNIAEAQKNGRIFRDKGYRYSFDMLGEGALTGTDARTYFNDYMQAIEAVGADPYGNDKIAASTVSIKLSALHPRYEVANEARVMTEMYDSLLKLLKRARELEVGITIDAEEADRHELSLKLFEKLYCNENVKGWGKLGLVIQAYSKRALPSLVWLAALAKTQGDLIPLRLVKGAYWDSELKLSQQRGYRSYPVFTRKEGTDVSYLACARFLLSEHVRGCLYPQFASHNAHTVSAVATMASHRDFEFQRLHGMGEALYNHALAMYGINVRIYAPVGNHKDLLPYLVRRLLENGTNSSFVHRLVDANCPVAELTRHPVEQLNSCLTLHNNHIPLPAQLFAGRKNSFSINLNVESEAEPFTAEVAHWLGHTWQAGPIINGIALYGPEADESMVGTAEPTCTVKTPYDRRIEVGNVSWSAPEHVEQALAVADEYFPIWSQTPVAERADCLDKLADLLEVNLAELVALCHQEAGKTIHDSIDEVREAVDFCRYYAMQASENFAVAKTVVRFDEISHQIERQGIGVFVCISPWNFPLAIFLGQVSAALVSGNTVVAKPAAQTSLIAARAIDFIFQAGVPGSAIQLLPGSGKAVGTLLTADPRVAGVVFTGSTDTAQQINRSLAARDTALAPLIAETGGQNAMIVDSTALPEQVVRDVMRSAFASAGQRCSALRVLYVQEEIADRIITLIQGAMKQLTVGAPYLHSTDVGPVMDATAKQKLMVHINKMTASARVVGQIALDDQCAQGEFVPPSAFEIDNISQLKQEHFGPVLHIIRYQSQQHDKVIDEINASGFGLTLGIHSRNERTYRQIERRARVGNCYINRDQVGAAVGVQPFGGQGLSGTGPKAGGPHYLYRFTREVITGPY